MPWPKPAEPPGRRQLFFYWRLSPGDVDAARAALRALCQALRAEHPALRARWYVRADTAPATLMEHYALDSGATGIDGALQQTLRRRGDQAVQPWLIGERHVEAFDALDD
jgi:hypothetical protein